MKKKSINKGWYYFFVVLVAYFILYFINKESFFETTSMFWNIMKKIIPILFVILILMTMINRFFHAKKVSKYIGKKSGIKGWLISMGGGLISHGPVYVWYPLLAELRSKGMRTGLVAAFIYNRAIKIPLLPLMIVYFSWEYVLILTLVMVFFSVISGMLVELLCKRFCSS